MTTTPQLTPPPPPRLAQLGVEWALDQTLGFPWYVALVFRAFGPNESIYRLIRPSEYGTHDSVGVRLRRPDLAAAGIDVVVDARPSPRLDGHAHYPAFNIGYGGVLRTLCDLSSLVPASLSPGTYTAELSYVGGPMPSHQTSSPTSSVRFHSAPRELYAWREQLRPLLQEKGTWLEVAEELVRSDPKAVTIAPGLPLAWPMLRALSNVLPDVFVKLLPGVFQGWGPPFEPHVRLLYVRWLIARRDLDRAREEAMSLRMNHFGLNDEIEALGLELPPIG